jgi:aldehyde dehydrogenase (NAD+)
MSIASDIDVTDYPMLIGGEWVGGQDGNWTEVLSPSRRGLVIGRVPQGESVDVDRAVDAARKAFPAWRDLHFKDRQLALLRIADALAEHAEELALLTATDTGNALRPQARPESQTLVSLFRYFGGVAGEFKGTVLPTGNDQLQYTRREPLGVVAAILPWNSPLMIAGMKVPAALAAGNAVILKPAADAPLTILRMAEIAAAFLPPGVLNVITGKGSVVGEALLVHPGVDKVSFTGSTEIGRHVAEVTGSRLAHTSLELGGKSPTIVFPDAATPDRIEATADGIMLGMRFSRQGQSCTAGSRLFIHESVYEVVLEAVARKASAMVVGDPLDEATDMGAIINESQYRSVKEYIAEGKTQPGVRVVLDGENVTPAGLDGFYQGPTIFAGVQNTWRIAREEIFGPVLVAIPWTDREEVIAMANDSHYGLAAFIWSQNLTEALDTAHRIDSGWVQVNQGGGQVIGQAYGGYKASGSGREFSIEGAIEGFTQTKQINVKLG